MNLTIPSFMPTKAQRSNLSIPTMSNKPALKVPPLQRSGNGWREKTTDEIIADFTEEEKRIAGFISAEINLLNAQKRGGIHWNDESTGTALKNTQALLAKESKPVVNYVKSLILKQRAL
jgi:hypothetical protein